MFIVHAIKLHGVQQEAELSQRNHTSAAHYTGG